MIIVLYTCLHFFVLLHGDAIVFYTVIDYKIPHLFKIII